MEKLAAVFASRFAGWMLQLLRRCGFCTIVCKTIDGFHFPSGRQCGWCDWMTMEKCSPVIGKQFTWMRDTDAIYAPKIQTTLVLGLLRPLLFIHLTILLLHLELLLTLKCQQLRSLILFLLFVHWAFFHVNIVVILECRVISIYPSTLPPTYCLHFDSCNTFLPA